MCWASAVASRFCLNRKPRPTLEGGRAPSLRDQPSNPPPYTSRTERPRVTREAASMPQTGFYTGLDHDRSPVPGSGELARDSDLSSMLQATDNVVQGSRPLGIVTRTAFDRVQFAQEFIGRVPLSLRDQISAFIQSPMSSTSDGGVQQLDQAFNAFAHEEARLSGKNIAHLVRPSGNIHSSLAIRLHYPTFTVYELENWFLEAVLIMYRKEVENGGTLDESNGCIRVLLRKGLSNEVFWYESYFRRETAMTSSTGERLVPTDAYHTDLKRTHESFSQTCEDLASFRVVLLAGVKSGAEFKARYNARSFEVRHYEVWLHLVMSQGRRVRIGVGMPHPEAFLRALSGKVRYPYKVAAQCDAAIEIATTLAGIDLDLTKDYFTSFLQSRYSGTESVFDFDESPMSALMAGRRREIEDGTSTPFESIPESILRYVAKEMKVTDVEAALRPRGLEETYLKNAHRVMFAKSLSTRKDGFYDRMKESKVAFERTVEMRRDMIMDTVCDGCGAHSQDDTPLFGTMEPVQGLYIARSTERCASKMCKPAEGKKSRYRNLVPADRSVKYIKRKSFRGLVQTAVGKLKE